MIASTSGLGYLVKGSASVMNWIPGAETGAVYGQSPHEVLTFVLGGKAVLLKFDVKLEPMPDPEFKADADSAARGGALFARNCLLCHGVQAVSGGLAPGLRVSPIPRNAEAFGAVLHDGILTPNGMPQFKEFSDRQRDDLRQYIRTEGDKFNKTYRADHTQ